MSDADTEETLTHPLSSDDSDSDADETDSLASSVAELSSGTYILQVRVVYVFSVPVEINLKQQLVDQLENAQRSFYTMKSQYEDKMLLLQQQIKSIESERDRVLKDISK